MRRSISGGSMLSVVSIPAIEQGFFQREIAESAYRYQRALDEGEKTMVGVNQFTEEGEKVEIPILTISPEVEVSQRKRLASVRASRDARVVNEALKALRSACSGWHEPDAAPHRLRARVCDDG